MPPLTSHKEGLLAVREGGETEAMCEQLEALGWQFKVIERKKRALLISVLASL